MFTSVYALTMTVIAQIKQTDQIEQLEQLMAHYCQDIQLDYYMFSLYRVESLVQPEIFMLDHYPVGWCDYYHEQNFYLNDPITAYCFEHVVPIFWDELILMPDFQDARYHVMFEQARRFGMHSGLSIPLSTTFGFKGIFNLATQSQSVQSRALLNQLCPYILLLSTHLMQWFQQYQILHTSKEPLKQPLTQREYECLFWACEGKSSWDISKILGVSERTIIFHLNHVMIKLGVNNRQHAVAKGLLTQLIRPQFK
ncbi:LuxR family transcriptional regulator [Acinetobacter rudis]|uniref:LuxR family transcriptional regulator n=1 Tax=Acinetobacter rudis TaxID=632955 RepID=UPI00280F416C|nr:LuxR family transcriptional regulator [Acinetobacter rudis]MDQ8953103.1 LuxR family transcriptional regulator [Acinetobacter rudis]